MDAQAILSGLIETAVAVVPVLFLADLMTKVDRLTAKVDQLLDSGTPVTPNSWLEAPVQEPEVGNSETYQVDLPGVGRPGTGAVIEEPIADAEEPIADAVSTPEEPKEPKAPKKTSTKAQAIATQDPVITLPGPQA